MFEKVSGTLRPRWEHLTLRRRVHSRSNSWTLEPMHSSCCAPSVKGLAWVFTVPILPRPLTAGCSLPILQVRKPKSRDLGQPKATGPMETGWSEASGGLAGRVYTLMHLSLSPTRVTLRIEAWLCSWHPDDRICQVVKPF